MQVLTAAVDALASAPEGTGRWSAAWSGTEVLSSPAEELIHSMHSPHAQAGPSQAAAPYTPYLLFHHKMGLFCSSVKFQCEHPTAVSHLRRNPPGQPRLSLHQEDHCCSIRSGGEDTHACRWRHICGCLAARRPSEWHAKQATQQTSAGCWQRPEEGMTQTLWPCALSTCKG